MNILIVKRTGADWNGGDLYEVSHDGDKTVLTDSEGNELRFLTADMERALSRCETCGGKRRVLPHSMALNHEAESCPDCTGPPKGVLLDFYKRAGAIKRRGL